LLKKKKTEKPIIEFNKNDYTIRINAAADYILYTNQDDATPQEYFYSITYDLEGLDNLGSVNCTTECPCLYTSPIFITPGTTIRAVAKNISLAVSDVAVKHIDITNIGFILTLISSSIAFVILDVTVLVVILLLYKKFKKQEPKFNKSSPNLQEASTLDSEYEAISKEINKCSLCGTRPGVIPKEKLFPHEVKADKTETANLFVCLTCTINAK